MLKRIKSYQSGAEIFENLLKKICRDKTKQEIELIMNWQKIMADSNLYKITKPIKISGYKGNIQGNIKNKTHGKTQRKAKSKTQGGVQGNISHSNAGRLNIIHIATSPYFINEVTYQKQRVKSLINAYFGFQFIYDVEVKITPFVEANPSARATTSAGATTSV